MSMYKESLISEGALTPAIPKVFEAVMAAIPTTIDVKMRAMMASTELITFASHLRKNINWQGSSIPVNAITMLIGNSGAGKGKALSAVRKVLKPAYKELADYRLQHAKVLAVEKAVDDGKKETDWRKYYSKPRDLIVAVSTLAGWVKHLNTLEEGALGCGTLYVDEISSELASSKDLGELLTALAILYDSGELAVKALKSDENQGEAVQNLPVNALLFGSPHGLLYDEAVKKKFISECSSKHARRFIFGYTPHETPLPAYASIADSRLADKEDRENTKEVIEKLSPWFTDLVSITKHDDLEVSDEVYNLFSDYINYNKEVAASISMLHPLSKIHREHRQWVALKVAGALAILNNCTEITKDHYIEAINFLELFTSDLEEFEIELSKEPYELAADYMIANAENGYINMSIHKLRKLGFIAGAGIAKNKMLELISLITSYDDVNTYEYAEGYIHFYEGEIAQTTEREELA